MRQLPTLPFTLANIRDLQFYSIYNLRQQDAYTLGDFNESTKKRIYQNYIKAYESDFQTRTGMSASQFSEKASLHSNMLDANEEFLTNFKVSQSNFSINNSTVMKYVDALMSGNSSRLESLKGKEKEILEALKDWSASAEAYLDTLSTVDDLYYFKNSGSAAHKGSIATASGRNVSEAFKLEKSSITAVQNADGLLQGLNQAIKSLETKGASVKDLTELTFYSASPSTNSSTEKTLQNLRSMTGALNNLMGFSFEVQVASGLERLVNSGIENIALLGGAKGVEITLSDGREFKAKQSKTDVRADIQGVDIGFSLKNISKKGNTKKISLNTSNTNQFISLLSNNQGYRSQLAGTLMWRADSIKNTSDQLTMFLASLTADYAIAMGGNDRVDYMVFNDKVIPLSEYYTQLEKTLRLKISPNASQRSYQKNLSEMRQQSILANMPVKYTG